jgi:hypothetical protein
MELPVQHVGSRRQTLALVLRQGAPTRPCAQGLRLHQTLDLVQTAIDALGQYVPPDAPGAIGAIGADEARPHLHADLFVIPAAFARRSVQPGMEP